MILHVLLLGVLPAILVLLCPLKRRGWIKNTLVWALTIGIGLGCFAAAKAPKPVVLFLVVGETAQAQNQQIDGYARETNPLLPKLDILNFGPATSCAACSLNLAATRCAM